MPSQRTQTLVLSMLASIIHCILFSDLILLIIASDGLWNMIHTINELLVNFSGHITIVLNDHQPMVIVRNILLLVLLRTISDNTKAA